METQVNCICSLCKKEFNRRLGEFNRNKKEKVDIFCSNKCRGESRKVELILRECKNCNKKMFVRSVRLETGHGIYCSRRCAGYWKSQNKNFIVKISKLEKYIQEQLVILYPKINFHFNRKDTINAELDIYLPDYKIGFELNGAFHYEPIFGKEQLQRIQNNDKRRFQACLERGIELVIIDSSKPKYFKIDIAKTYLKIVTDIIDEKLKTN